MTGAIVLSPGLAHAIDFGQLDNFQDGTVMGWVEGAVTPNPPTNIPDGGPNGVGDRFLQNISSGGAGAGSKQVMYNTTQWIGDYNAAKVTRMQGWMANQGTTPLHMRVAIKGGIFSTIFGSTNAIVLPADGVWRPVVFSFTASGMSLVAGPDPLADVLSSVSEIRILSSQTAPGYTGDAIISTLGVDNLRAMTIPGDADFSGLVNLNDFNILASNFGTASGATWGQADFDFNGNVNLNDFNSLAGNFGLSASPGGPTAGDWSALAAAVPEPGALGSILVLTGAALARRRRCAVQGR
jgi:hypothetical protein